MSSIPLTQMQHKTLEYVRKYRADNGISPTLGEVAADFGISRVSVHGHIRELERKNRIVRFPRGGSRNLSVVGESLRDLSKLAECQHFLKQLRDGWPMSKEYRAERFAALLPTEGEEA